MHKNDPGESRVESSLTENDVRKYRDENGLGLIHWAADRGCLEIVRILAGNPGLDVNLQDDDGQTALHYACSNGHRDVTEFLLTLDGIDVTLRDSDGIAAQGNSRQLSFGFGVQSCHRSDIACKRG